MVQRFAVHTHRYPNAFMSKLRHRTLELGHCGADIAHGDRRIRNKAARIALCDSGKLFISGLRNREALGRLEGVDAANILEPQNLSIDAGGCEHFDPPRNIRLLRADTACGPRPGPDYFSAAGPFYARVITAATQVIEKGLRLEVGMKIDDSQAASSISA